MVLFLTILLVLVLGFTAYFVIQRGIGAIYSNPLVLGILFFAVIHLLLPLMQINADYFRYQNEYNIITILISIILVVVGQFVVGFIFYLNFTQYISYCFHPLSSKYNVKLTKRPFISATSGF